MFPTNTTENISSVKFCMGSNDSSDFWRFFRVWTDLKITGISQSNP